MPNALNQMIAQGFQPTIDMVGAQKNALAIQGGRQALAERPRQMELREEEMRLKELALDIKARAMQAAPKAGNISLDYPFGTIAGPQDKIAMAADALAQYPDQAKDPQFMPWLAQQGISLKGKQEPAEKSQTEEMLTRAALKEAYGRDPTSQEILDAMQKRKIQTAQAMPAPTVYVGDVGGKPAVTGGTKGGPSLKVLDTPGNQPLLPKGSEKLSDAQRKTMDQIGSAKSLVSTLKTMWDSIAPQSRLEGTKLFAAAKVGQNPEAKAYMDERKAFLGIISRSIGGEVGVLTDRDIDRIDKALARIGANPLENDTAEEAELKWNTILQIIDEAEQRFVNSMSVKTKSEAIEQVGKQPQKVGRFTIKEK